ncbi:uroporphyrinogen-III C-methyltransferase [Kwoniella heveanensis CBS 569]|uniref:Uroporphyrinogen-III C-methyltransferase n=1 Tax=Kwoniella heveanensis BCC8398 TaxID=1296120 RepID=A0A1B9GTK6_9TREE|nr:uroporphyrinogen-III C-methyltransferase [Kwoniella heveanensis BCC8398]OCF42684.1 uroporphyrinogen-III C-methyltransferase [Kwoniella heveanensis CBS 569]
MQIQDKRPPMWVSYWMAFSIAIVTWDAAYCFLRPRSFGTGDLAWIWAPYNMVPYSMVDYLYGQQAVDSGDGFTNAQALMNVIEVILAMEYLYLRHTSPRVSSKTPNPAHHYHAHAPLVGFAGALMTLSKTALYFLQEYFCDWCMVGHNNRFTFWTVWVATNDRASANLVSSYFRTWVVVPFIVCVVLGQFITEALMRDTATQIAYYEHITAEKSPSATPPEAHPNGKVIEEEHLTNGNAEHEELSASISAPTSVLPLTFHLEGLSVLIIGSNRLAATRASTFTNAQSRVTIASRSPLSEAAEEVRHLVETSVVSYEQLKSESSRSWSSLLSKSEASLVCVTDTLIGSTSRRNASSARLLFEAALSLRIPVNISDQPTLSTFTFPSVHRFLGNNGQPSNLYVAVTTNGQGCRLSGRIKREIVSRLPGNVGTAVDNVGKLRAHAKAKAAKISDDDDTAPLNSPVPQIATPSISRNASVDRFEVILSEEEQQLRRMRWVHQMSEYYSFEHLARLKDRDLESALELWSSTPVSGTLTHHGANPLGKGKGRILLIGSGPGHPGLLTCAAHHALKTATLILSDKLVPAEILALIPPSTKLHIAKKFPGNAEGAQNEMMELALAGAQAGEVVVRLKQGDPFVYGRGGEEVLYFREHGFESIVIPGISSALAAPLMMGIPVTQRGVAESLVMCTGVGRQGKAVQLPGYIKSRTLVMLMGVARIKQIIEVLTSAEAKGRDGVAYPRHLPIGIIERASSPDQRVILSTLGEIEESLKKVDERPPGMMIVGWAALCLEGKGRVDILDRGVEDEEGIVQEWLGAEGYKIREGLDEGWKEILAGIQ